MKILDRIGLVIFSTIILLVSLILALTLVGAIKVELILGIIELIFTHEIASKVIFGLSIVFILLAVKCIFFNADSSQSSKGKDGILLENDNGKLLVSKDTIENLTNSVVKNFETAQNVMTRVEVSEESNLKIFITLFVYPEAVIKELTAQIQKDIKETIKKSLDLDVSEVNVRIKNITVKKENKE